jgi:prophage maintenance system killer protein
LIQPDLKTAVAFNAAVRADDEWFAEPDELDRVQRALESISTEQDVVTAVGLLVARIVRAQGFSEGNKRTALALGVWMLHENKLDAQRYFPPSDRVALELLLRSARGEDVSAGLVSLLKSRESSDGDSLSNLER